MSEKPQKREVCVAENNREREKRDFRAVSLLFLTPLLYEIFRFLFIVCLNSVVFPHTKQTGERLKREVCFENNNRERERVRESESVSGRCF